MELQETIVSVSTDADVITARQTARTFAASLDFSTLDLTFIATAASEIARNIVEHAERGEMHIAQLERGGRRGLEVVATDRGPGIPDVARVLRGGYSSTGTLGIGIAGARRLMDEFEITPREGGGTVVTMRKWERNGILRRSKELV